MYEIIKKVIEAKRFELSEILRKIDTLWLQGSITEEQKGRLVQLAREHANVQESIDVMAKLEEMNRRLVALEEKIKGIDFSDSEPNESTETIDGYVVGKWYYNGNKVSFEGKTYTCTAPDGVVCVWSPSEYPAYWEIEE